MLYSAPGMEARMTGILDKFYVEHGIHIAIQFLKDDLDACGKEMKRLVKANRSGSLFEGWPTDA